MRDARYFVVEGRLYLIAAGSVYEWSRVGEVPGWVSSETPASALIDVEREVSVQEAMRLQRA